MNLLAIATGFLQLTILLLFVLLLARSARHKSPDLAAKIGTLGLLLGCLVVALVAMDVPRVIHKSIRSPIDASTEGISPTLASSKTSSRPAPTLSINPLLVWLADQKIHQVSQDRTGVDWRLLGCVLGLLLFSPLVIGWLATVQMHHRSIPLPKQSRQELPFLVPCQDIEMRVSQIILVPCVTYYGGRTIYLPPTWNQWPADELSAALAHESAHLDRRDARQRLLIQFACFVQWFHPLAWLLGRSVMLSQEMAADRQAASLSHSNYAVGLSKIALRADQLVQHGTEQSLKHWFTRPGMVSVSSSHLIRRIKMLSQRTEGSVSCFRVRLSQLAVFAVFVTSVGWNLHADQPDGDSSAKTPQLRIASAGKHKASSKLFSRPTLAPWEHVPPNNHGYAAVRVRQILQQPSLAFAAAVLDPAIDGVWRMIATDQAAGDRVALGFSLSNLDDALVSLHANLVNEPPKEGEDSDKNGNFTLGTDGMVLRFIKPISHDDVRAALDIDRVVHVAEQNGLRNDSLGGMTTTQVMQELLDGIFSEGASTHELAVTPEAKEATQTQIARLKKAWKKVDGGVVTLCSVLPDSIGHVDDETDKQADQLLSQVAAMGMGIDVGKPTDSSWLNTPLHVRLALLPTDGVTADQLLQTAQAAVAVWKQEAINVSGDSEEKADAKKIIKVLDSLTIFPSPARDGVMVAFQIPLSSFGVLGAF